MSGEPGPTETVGSNDTGAAKIADPENYNLRRRLKQLHDAKERVRNTADSAVRMEMTDRSFTVQKRDRLVAEAVADYILELKSLLKKRGEDEDFLNTEIGTVENQEITLEYIAQNRGSLTGGGDSTVIPYDASMSAWAVCNDNLDEFAGAEFEEDSTPPGANPVDPAGRLDE